MALTLPDLDKERHKGRRNGSKRKEKRVSRPQVDN
jgi:hypothetical protein